MSLLLAAAGAPPPADDPNPRAALFAFDWQPDELSLEVELANLPPGDPLEGILALFEDPGVEEFPEPDYLAQFIEDAAVVDDPEARIALYDEPYDDVTAPDYLAQFIEQDGPEHGPGLYDDVTWASIEAFDYVDVAQQSGAPGAPNTSERRPYPRRSRRHRV